MTGCPYRLRNPCFAPRWLVHADAVEGVDYEIDKVLELAHMANIEDKTVVELQQQGVNSPAYVPGPYHQPLEGDARKFIANYLAMVQEKRAWSC